MFSDLLSLVYPETCFNCNDTLISAEKFICTQCKADMPRTNDHLNPINSLFQKFAYEEKIGTVSSFLYFTKGGVAQKLLHNLKYNGLKEIGNTLGEWYGHDLAGYLRTDLILPVPIHKSKKRKRGYNQSLHIAEGIASSLGHGTIRQDLVERTRKTTSQTRKSKVERWLNIENVYSDCCEDLSGVRVLIVDDVITTGATIGMLCEKLKKANVERVDVISVARG